MYPHTPSPTARPLHVLVAPSGFKESLGPVEVAEHIATGLRRSLPDAHIDRLPLVDGGEGFTAGMVDAAAGTLHRVSVTGPLGEPVDATIGLLPGEPVTAVLEIAAAAGLRLVPRERRDPRWTTSAGVGELIRHALDLGARRLLVGCGDSGVSDGGAGMAVALGARLLDAEGRELALGAAPLVTLRRIDPTGLDRRLADTDVVVACNPTNVLCGPTGVARVYGPQKGADPRSVDLLDRALARWADLLERTFGRDLRTVPGGGASGGLGAGLSAICGARLRPRFEVTLHGLDLDRRLAEADVVITAEGSLDGQTPNGKIPAEVGRRARSLGVPVIALAGTLGAGHDLASTCGIDAYTSILDRPRTLEEAVDRTGDLLEHAARQVGALLEVGRRLAPQPVAA
ncbi:MAG: glycerate kinase [Acidimicrobiales bacterium]|jgi:glycerate kinase|nr:glycerate kinase [Acidimicrobiales bacterium]